MFDMSTMEERERKFDAIMRHRREMDLLLKGEAMGISRGEQQKEAEIVKLLIQKGMGEDELSTMLQIPKERILQILSF